MTVRFRTWPTGSNTACGRLVRCGRARLGKGGPLRRYPSLFGDLIRLRRNWFDTTALCGHNVNVHHVNRADKLIAFHRWAGGGPRDDVVVIANFANRGYADYRVGLPRGGCWRVRLNSDRRGYSPAFTDHASFDLDASSAEATDGMPCGASVGLGPYTCLILSQDT